MKDKFLKKRKKYTVALLAATAATVATSFSPSAPGVMASGNGADVANDIPDSFNPPTYTEVPFDPNAVNLNIPYYHVQAGDNVSVTTNTFVAGDYDGNVNATFNNFIVKANDTLVEDSDDIVVDTGNSENPEKGTENGVTRKYKLKLSDSLKEELKNAAAGGGGGADPSKLEAGTNTTVEGDGTATPYKVNLNSDLTGITSITGDTLTLHGGATTVAISDNGVDVGGKKITNLKEGDVSENSTDAVTGKQLHETNEKVEAKLDKAAERHIKPGDYTVENGTVTLKYVDADGTETGEEATISGLNPVKSVASGNTDAITVDNNNGDITITPVVAADITKADDANKLATAGVVNTAINNAIEPLADKNLSNITDAGKKVITGLGTEVVQGDGVTVTSDVDATTGKKTYTISAVKPSFADGSNTTVVGDGTATPYKVNLNSDLTGITSITGDTLTLNGGTTAVSISDDGVDVGGKKITNLADAALTNSSTDAVTGKQLHETNEKVEAKLDKAAERHIKPGDYTVENGTVTLKYVDADGTETGEEATISGLNPVKSVASGNTDAITVDNNNGDITITPVVAADITKADDANKLATAGVVNTAINNAIEPLADKNLSNITDAGKKVITGLGTEVVQGDGVTVTSDVDATTGKKTYTISAVKPKFAAGTNTTVDGNGTDGNEYTVNVKSDLTGITSITGDNGLTFTGAGTAVTINGDGVDVGGKKITNLKEGDVSENSTDAVTGKQLNATNTKVANLEANKLDKTDDVHVQAGKYSVAEDGTVTLPLVKGEADTATGKNVVIDGIVTKAVLSAEVDKHDLNIAGDNNSQHTTKLKDGISIKGSSNFTSKEAGINIQAIATDKGFEVKLSDTLTNMKGITFAPTTQGGASVSLTSAGLDNGGNTITNVAAGVNDTDAVNVSQLKGLANATMNVDGRINRLGAQSAAMAGLRHLQYDPLEPTTLMAGVGTYKGQTALALGIAHYKNESLLFHAGASIGSNHDELMANAGVSWKFGSRADETAVKDAYRQGPISASYTLQDKVSALEAQNQLQKDEINELKAQLAEVLQYIKKG